MITSVKSLEKSSHDQEALRLPRIRTVNPPTRAMTHIERHIRPKRLTERMLRRLEMEDSLQEASIVMSRRFEAIPDFQLPQLVEGAKNELAELQVKDQEQWAGHEAIRGKQWAEIREERKQQRLMERQGKLARSSGYGRKPKGTSDKDHVSIIRYIN